MNRKNMVSIIIPTYNAETHLRESIDSMVNQTYTNWEIIVIDDFSKDRTREIIKEYEKKDKRIKLVDGPKQMIGGALNLGIDLSKGDYIARMDADDISLPSRLEKQVRYMEEHKDVDLCATQFEVFENNGNVLYTKKVGGADDEIKAGMLFECAIGHPTVMFRSASIKGKWKYNTFIIAEDYDLWSRMMPTVKFGGIQETLLKYRLSSNGASVGCGERTLFAAASISQKCIENIFGIEIQQYQNIYMDKLTKYVAGKSFEAWSKELEFIDALIQRNHRLQAIDEQAMLNALQKRWKRIETVTDILNNISKNNTFNILSDLTLLFNKKMTLQQYKDLLATAEKEIGIWFSQKKTITICGMGKVGKQILDRYFMLKDSGVAGWRLAAVTDKNASNVNMKDKKYEISKLEHIHKMKPDYVLIASEKYYEEIRNEIMAIGIEEEQIINGRILFLNI